MCDSNIFADNHKSYFKQEPSSWKARYMALEACQGFVTIHYNKAFIPLTEIRLKKGVGIHAFLVDTFKLIQWLEKRVLDGVIVLVKMPLMIQ